MPVEYRVYETEVYAKWFASLKDERAKARIGKRIDRAKYGNFGDWKTEAGEPLNEAPRPEGGVS